MAQGTLNPDESFTAMTVTRSEIADFLNGVYADYFEPESLAFMPLDGTEEKLTNLLCMEFCGSMEASLDDGIDEDLLLKFATETLVEWGGETLE